MPGRPNVRADSPLKESSYTSRERETIAIRCHYLLKPTCDAMLCRLLRASGISQRTVAIEVELRPRHHG